MENEHSKYKILIVDDDTFLLNMYALKFTKSNFEVTTALSGDNVLKLLRDGFVPDIMLVDVVMPGLDGLELLAQIRKLGLIQNTTIIMLTNQSDSNDIERAKALNVNGYIVKATTIPSEVISEVTNIHQKAHKA
jgi:CheY-like chemotaxis protein